MPGPQGYIFCWMLYLSLVVIVALVTMRLERMGYARRLGPRLRSGALHSIAGVALVQFFGLPIVLLMAWGITTLLSLASARRVDLEAPEPSTPILTLTVVGVTALLSSFGAYLGFRAGWEVANRRRAAGLIQTDPVIRRVASIGSVNPVRWYLGVLAAKAGRGQQR